MNLHIDGAKIADWASFHGQFAEKLGFPGFYGRTMDAWIDCMSCLDDPSAGMTSVHVARGEVLTICLSRAGELRNRCPEMMEALMECATFVNQRRIEHGEPAILALSLDGESSG